ncbi:hypothetical protein [Aureimonas psammosilenae]|uniref:hypothetical protein n=1 Tax=Aureimonas psammosilenae TaxID=2495496 RepID=UPI001869BF39|nr:hypothetical protein [Aureimonas psammosilenae]
MIGHRVTGEPDGTGTLLDAIMGYQGARRAATDRAIPKEELARAIMSGGVLTLGAERSR